MDTAPTATLPGTTTCESGIYQIVSRVDSKTYIGSAKSLADRKWMHFNSKWSNIHLQRAMNKYGKDVFEFRVLEYVEVLEQLISREQFWIDKARAEGKVLYNIALVAGSNLGIKHPPRSKEFKDRISKANTGRKQSEEQRRKNADAHRGVKFTEERLRRMSTGRRGKGIGKSHPQTEKTKRLISIGNTGKKRTEEQRKKNSDWHTGRPGTRTGFVTPEERKERIRAKLVGRRFTEDQRRRVSEGVNRYYQQKQSTGSTT